MHYGRMERSAIAWTVTLVLLALDAAWLGVDGWSIPWARLVLLLLALIASIAPLAFERYRRDLRIGTTLDAAALLIVFTNAAATLSYLVVSTGAPLMDASLAAWDRALGFDWLALHTWLVAHPFVNLLLAAAYCSGLVQILIVVLFLGLTARTGRLREFISLFVLATLVAITVSSAFPAAGPWKHFGVKSVDLAALSDFEPLRDGRLRHIPLGAMQGLIAMPSLHASFAVLFVYVMRGTGIAFAAFLLLNILMLISTPTEGGHYLVDVLAGCSLAVGLIVVFRRPDLAFKAHVHRTDVATPGGARR